MPFSDSDKLFRLNGIFRIVGLADFTGVFDHGNIHTGHTPAIARTFRHEKILLESVLESEKFDFSLDAGAVPG